MAEAIIGVLGTLCATPYAPMAGRWELNDEQWAVVEPLLRPACRADDRGCP